MRCGSNVRSSASAPLVVCLEIERLQPVGLFGVEAAEVLPSCGGVVAGDRLPGGREILQVALFECRAVEARVEQQPRQVCHRQPVPAAERRFDLQQLLRRDILQLEHLGEARPVVQEDARVGLRRSRAQLRQDRVGQVLRLESDLPHAALGNVRREHEEEREEDHRDEHVEPEGMDVGVDLPGVELAGQQPRAAEEQPERLPHLAVELVDVLEILPDVFPEGLLDVERILSAAAAIHALEPLAAVLAVGVGRDGAFADALEPPVFDAPEQRLPAGCEPLAQTRAANGGRGRMVCGAFGCDAFRCTDGGSGAFRYGFCRDVLLRDSRLADGVVMWFGSFVCRSLRLWRAPLFRRALLFFHRGG